MPASINRIIINFPSESCKSIYSEGYLDRRKIVWKFDWFRGTASLDASQAVFIDDRLGGLPTSHKVFEKIEKMPSNGMRPGFRRLGRFRRRLDFGSRLRGFFLDCRDTFFEHSVMAQAAAEVWFVRGSFFLELSFGQPA